MQRKTVHLFFTIFLSFLISINGHRKCFNLGIQPVTKQKFNLGESPYWSVLRQKLYFVDVTAGSYHAYNPYTGSVVGTKTDCPSLSFIIPVKGTVDNFIIGCGDSLDLIKWDGSEGTGSYVRSLTEIKGDNERINVGKVDSKGRLFTATMTYASDAEHPDDGGALYRIGDNLAPEQILDGISIPAGLAWNGGDSRMFINDIASGVVQQFIFHKENGTISNGNTFFDLKAHNITGYPAGITVDLFGDLWVSAFRGGKILRLSGTTGELVCYIDVPVSGVTGVTFGGPLLSVLYVTTSGNSTLVSDDNNENAGALFSIRGLFRIGRFSNQFVLNSS